MCYTTISSAFSGQGFKLLVRSVIKDLKYMISIVQVTVIFKVY